jgi:hypothetical protein
MVSFFKTNSWFNNFIAVKIEGNYSIPAEARFPSREPPQLDAVLLPGSNRCENRSVQSREVEQERACTLPRSSQNLR